MPGSARTRFVALAAAVAALCITSLAGTALAGSPSVQSPTTQASTTTCDISGDQRKLGPTYVTSLKVKGVGCRTGRRVVRGYYRCRIRAGGRKGRCHSKVLHFSCKERRQAISTEFDAHVTCTRGRSRVWHDYTQFT
jgi:hypothetical protein